MPDDSELSIGSSQTRVQLTCAPKVFRKCPRFNDDNGVELEAASLLGREQPEVPVASVPGFKALPVPPPALAAELTDHFARVDCDDRS